MTGSERVMEDRMAIPQKLFALALWLDSEEGKRWYTDLREVQDDLRKIAGSHAALVEENARLRDALENTPLPSTMGGWGEFLPRFYDWYEGQRRAALSAPARVVGAVADSNIPDARRVAELLNWALDLEDQIEALFDMPKGEVK